MRGEYTCSIYSDSLCCLDQSELDREPEYTNQELMILRIYSQEKQSKAL